MSAVMNPSETCRYQIFDVSYELNSYGRELCLFTDDLKMSNYAKLANYPKTRKSVKVTQVPLLP